MWRKMETMKQYLSQSVPLYLRLVGLGCRIHWLQLWRRVRPNPNEATCYPWAETSNASGRDPGGWAVLDPAIEMVMWLAALYLDPYYTRQAVKEAWSNQSAVHVKP